MKSHIIRRPVITEKSLKLAQQSNKYTFLVDKSANKNQIKQAISDLFDVKVERVNSITHHRVHKTTGRKRMKTVLAPTKKVIVQLKKGQTIDLFEFGENKS